jgi:hypothetical protein
VRLNMNERRAVIRIEAQRYRKARKREKGKILDEVVAVTGYHRWYAVSLLRARGKGVGVRRGSSRESLLLADGHIRKMMAALLSRKITPLCAVPSATLATIAPAS